MKLSKRISLSCLVCLLFLLGTCQEEASAKLEGYYTCSMHPEVISHEPGTCPICKMDLSYIDAAQDSLNKDNKENLEMQNGDGAKSQEAEQYLRFSLTSTVLANANLATIPALKQTFSRRAKYSAHIDYNENSNHLVIISTKYDGWIESLLVSKEGQQVRRGQRLLGIYSPNVFSAKEEYITIYNTLKSLFAVQNKPLSELSKDPTLQATKQKLLYLDVSSREIKRLEQAGKTSRRSYYTSPISGVIVKKSVLQGDYIKAGQEILRIADLSSLWVIFHIFEKDLPLVHNGQKVTLKTQAYPDKEIAAHIDLIYPFLDPKSRDIKVRIVLRNPKGLLKPGMFAEVEVAQNLSGKHIVISDSAVIYSGDKSYVFVSLGKGRFEMRRVKLLFSAKNQSVVAQGLKENELIVVNGQFLLSSEASLKETLSRFQEETPKHH